jgi:hypothetical protein
MRYMRRVVRKRLHKLGKAIKSLEKLEQWYAKKIKVVRKKRKELAAEHRELLRDVSKM